MRQEESDQMAAAPRDRADQVLGVPLESFSVTRIDLMANEAGYRHRLFLQ
jgi:hypothetical protein